MNDTLLNQVAWIGEDILSGPIRGIVLQFSGLGATGMKSVADDTERELGEAGALVVLPYHDPWSWTNAPTRAFYDELVDGLFAHYVLPPDTPIIASGGSMGGHGALLYTILGGRPVAACAANCPVCDLPFHYTERVDLPRTMHHAFGSYSDISSALVSNSPLHLAGRMPDIPYLIVHGEDDMAVGKAPHSDKLVEKMRTHGLNVDYREQAGMGHCGPFDPVLQRRWTEFVLEQLAAKAQR